MTRVPDIDAKKFLFIGGLHRSGTSILHRLLCEHPATSGFHDTGVPEDEGQHLQSVIPAAHEFGGPGEFAFHAAAHLTEASALSGQRSRDRILREWGAYYDLEKSVLLEKSPPNLIRSRFLRQMFPGALFVFIVRHPIAVSLATEKWSDKTLGERLLHWNAAHSIMLEDIESRADCLLLRYEDFVAAPNRHLDQICDLVGIERFSAREAVVDHNQKYFRDWLQRRQADAETLPALLSADDSVVEAFGYSLAAPLVSQG